MIYLLLFFEFFKIGLFAVGGGLATLPFIYDIADKYGWLSYSIIADMIAVAESTPGAIGVNIATYTGFIRAGILGSAVATIALVIPSTLIVIFAAKALDKYQANLTIQSIFSGLRPAATGLIAAAGYSVLKLSLYDEKAKAVAQMLRWKELILFVVLFALIWKFKKHPIIYIACAAAIGIILSL
ncbi:MAG: chromate transporter [Treponemataceae bacterium]